MSSIPTASSTGTAAPDIQHLNAESGMSTPGFPGAFPRGGDDANASQPPDALNAAKNLDLQGTITSVGQTAKSYLPESVASYFQGAQPESTAPAPAGTTKPDGADVAPEPSTLPTERPHLESTMTGVSVTAQDGSTAGGKTPSRSPPSSQFTPSANNMPHRTDSPPAKVETVLEQPLPNLSARDHPLGGAGAHLPNQAPVDGQQQSLVPPTPPPKSPEPGPAQSKQLPSSTVAENGHGSSSSMFDNGSRFKESTDSTRDLKSLNMSNHTQESTEGESLSSASGGTPKKHKFMDKIKGEAKVISGKIGRNEEKVEVGKRLLGKE